mmetsp:Transcript_10541/g.30108  ORF Transcript_10541/g.30108 Transcript_10541/m.30108 type:complete len:126 (+) Transcript_10541:517-894(+)
MSMPDTHTQNNPTVLSIVVGDMLDLLLTGSVPHLVAIAMLRPHPLVVMYAAMCSYSTFFVYVHSGMSIPALNFLFGGFFPFRATPVLHDRHHKYSGRKSTDMGVMFWIWDWLAGTLDERTFETCR